VRAVQLGTVATVEDVTRCADKAHDGPFLGTSTIDLDESLIAEGTRRLRAAGFSDEQIGEWLSRVRLWGGRISLTQDGLRAEYARPDGHVAHARAQAGVTWPDRSGKGRRGLLGRSVGCRRGGRRERKI